MSILAYHMVEPRFDWGATRVTPKQFERQIEAVMSKDLGCVTLSEYGRSAKLEERRLAITFDDGYASVYHHAFPVLRAHDIKATVFLIAGYAGQMNAWDINIGGLRFPHLDWRQIELLAEAGWEFGSHGMSHRDLTLLTDAELRRELELSRQIIERRSGCHNGWIAYPFGNVNARVWHAAVECGYRSGVVMGSRPAEVPEPYARIRSGIYLFDSRRSFEHKIDGRRQWLYSRVQRVMDLCSDGSVIVKRRSW